MTIERSRRDVLKGTLAVTTLALFNIPEWALPALAQGETLVPFADAPPTFPAPGPVNRQYDIRTIDGPFSPADRFFTTQHYGHPVVEPAAFRLKLTGLVNRPTSFSLDELRKVGSMELIVGFECSGNRRPLQGLSGNGRWAGVPLRAVLDRAGGLRPQAREMVFFGADRAQEEVEFRTQKFTVEQQYGRSMTREQLASSDAFLAWALNGEPLTRHQGSPLRLLVPGWYGMANVKFLAQIHAQEDAYLGKFQARHYRTLRGETIDGEVKWTEAAITQMQLKSFLARVTKNGSRYTALGVVLHDGTPLKAVEVRVDDGPWQPATLDPATRAKYSWKLFAYVWNNPAPGEHTLVSRVIDVNGRVQPTLEELESKKTFLEDNSQHPRKVTITL
jgi:DMSO/TMAO reductase YedYZ molybdopterin-dependent catalytic subunit